MKAPAARTGIYRRIGKRGFDLSVGCLALLVTAPLALAIGLTVAVVDGRPILFRQRRPGLHANLFELLKFRTMRVTEGRGAENDSERLTRLGRILRRTSLDELPELWNVVRGEMSLVGPRPLLSEYLPLYSEEQNRRHSVRPGITGWAQVRGRNLLSWEEKFAHDLWYVDNHSLTVDLKILFMTLFQVIRGHGVSAADHATMEKFEGSQHD